MSKPEQDPWPPLEVVCVLADDGVQLVPELYECVGRALGRPHSSDRALAAGFLAYVQSLDSLPEVVA